jgi:hypothetical protein
MIHPTSPSPSGAIGDRPIHEALARLCAEVHRTYRRGPVQLTKSQEKSQRAAGDALEARIIELVESEAAHHFPGCTFSAGFGSKDMQDCQITTAVGKQILIDVKTFRTTNGWGSPNVTSVDRLAKLYHDPSAYFALFVVDYEWRDASLPASRMQCALVEHITIQSLKIGNLGRGQLQIRDSATFCVDQKQSRDSWIDAFIPLVLAFYAAQEQRIKKQSAAFSRWKDERATHAVQVSRPADAASKPA